MDKIARASAVDRADFFQDVHARRPEIEASIAEKDFWVCWTLRRIFEVLQFRPHLIFKGGTSLAKVHRAIERFSEDVDLSLSRRDLGFADDRDPEQAGISSKEARRRLDALVAECKTVVREKLVPELRRDFTTVLRKANWSVALDPDPQTVIFTYPSTEVSGGMSYVSPAIRLEMGARSDDWPAADADITSYAAEAFPDLFTIRSCKVRTLAAERTFWEKATLLHAEYHRPADKPCRARLSRHYYDLYRLSQQEIGRQALTRLDLLERVIKHKSFFFARSWAQYDQAKAGSFHLIPSGARMQELQNDYAQMKPMIFGDYPQWDEIIRGLKQLEERINSG